MIRTPADKKLRYLSKISSGFTLIELLIVIAVLGVLAVVILIALNPNEQLRKTRDSGRVEAISQIGNALQAYATSSDGFYVPEAGTGCTNTRWIDCLIDKGEIKTLPSLIDYSNPNGVVACTMVNVYNGICYNASNPGGNSHPIVVYSTLESQQNIDKCTNISLTKPFAVFSSLLARGGVACTNGTEPVPNMSNATFVD